MPAMLALTACAWPQSTVDRAPLHAKSVGVSNGIRGGAAAIDVAPEGAAPRWLVAAEDGLWRVDGEGSGVLVDGVEGPITAMASCGCSAALVALADGSLRQVTVDGLVATVSPVPSPSLAEPIVALACTGTMTVAAATRQSVTVFDAMGSILWSSTPDDEVGRPGGLAFGPDGTLFVSDADRSRVVAFNRTGQVTAEAGSRGSFPGQFKDPRGLSWHDGLLYVADRLNHRIVRLRPDLTFVDCWGMHAVWPRSADGATHYPVAAAISNDGASALVVEPFERRVQRFDTVDAAEQDRLAGLIMPSVDGVQSHFGPSVDAASGRLVVFDPEGGALVVFLHTLPQPVHVTTIGMPGTPMPRAEAASKGLAPGETLEGPGRLGRVKSLAISRDGTRVLVADESQHTLSLWELGPTPEPLRFDPFLSRMRRVVSMASLGGREVADMASTSDGWLVLWDDRASSTPGMASLTRLDHAMRVRSDSAIPTPNGRATRIDTLDDGVALLCPSAHEVIVSRGGESTTIQLDQSTMASDLEWLRDGFLVSDARGDQVQSLAPDGSPMSTIGTTGMSDGRFWSPDAVTCDESGHIIVVDGGNHRLQTFARGADGALSWTMTFSLGRAYTRPRNLDAQQGDGE